MLRVPEHVSVYLQPPTLLLLSQFGISPVHGAKRPCAMDFIPWVIKQHYVAREFGLIVKLRLKPLSSSTFSRREIFPEHGLIWHNGFCGSFCDICCTTQYCSNFSSFTVFLGEEKTKRFMHFRCNCAVCIAVLLMLFHHCDITIRK